MKSRIPSKGLFGLVLFMGMILTGCEDIYRESSANVNIAVKNETGRNVTDISLTGSGGTVYRLSADGTFEIGQGRYCGCTINADYTYALCWVDGNNQYYAKSGGVCGYGRNNVNNFSFQAGESKTIILKPENKWEIQNGIGQ
ncbi:MAG: hypothetical protein LBD55_09310 [Treponema sp.]|jgi:hypothetical protein|nr:hypothetical protein [Treponema sp.]